MLGWKLEVAGVGGKSQLFNRSSTGVLNSTEYIFY